MNKFFIQTGAIFGALSVALGAFGAHALKAFLETNARVETFETGIKYMFYHAIALVLVGIIFKDFSNKFIKLSGRAFIIGILFFTGSLLLICFTGNTLFGAIAPIGGLSLIFGWITLGLGLRK